jgi:hypothetical protein
VVVVRGRKNSVVHWLAAYFLGDPEFLGAIQQSKEEGPVRLRVIGIGERGSTRRNEIQTNIFLPSVVLFSLKHTSRVQRLYY